MEAVATAAAAREPDEGEAPAAGSRREGGAAVSLGNDSPWARRRTLYRGTPALRFISPLRRFVQVNPSRCELLSFTPYAPPKLTSSKFQASPFPVPG